MYKHIYHIFLLTFPACLCSSQSRRVSVRPAPSIHVPPFPSKPARSSLLAEPTANSPAVASCIPLLPMPVALPASKSGALRWVHIIGFIGFLFFGNFTFHVPPDLWVFINSYCMFASGGKFAAHARMTCSSTLCPPPVPIPLGDHSACKMQATRMRHSGTDSSWKQS